MADIYKLIKNPSPKLIDELSKNDIKYLGGRNCPYRYIHDELKMNKNKDFNNFLKELTKQKAEILSDIDYVKALQNLLKYKDNWVRPISTWKKKTRSRDRQFEEIANHLFVKYDMPKFMYSSWFWNRSLLDLTQIQWFIDIGNGQNIRKSKGLPFPLTKKMAHIFMSAPDNFTPKEAIRYAQIIDMGGDMRTIRGVMSSKLKDDYKNHDFWTSVIRFFINNPMLDIAQYNPIVDYIHMMKYENRTVIVDGVRQLLPPEKVNFSMKDRDPNVLIEQVEKWHNNISKGIKKGQPTHWEPNTRINDFVFTTGKDHMKQTFSISQITMSKDLIAEGRALGHCVGSYINSCVNGRSIIFSMTLNSMTKINERLVTIEVNKEGIISQIRGKGNRLPTNHETAIIDKWAYQERLSKSKWL